MRIVLFCRLIIWICLASVILPAWGQDAENAPTGPMRALVLLNWSEYMDPELITAFEAQHNVKVREVFFDSDTGRTEILRATDARGFDVVLVSGADMANYIKYGWLRPITDKDVPNLKHSHPRWLEAYGGVARGYGVPHLWGSTGILYRKDKVTEPITQWKQLFEPAPALKGKILMLNDPRELIGNALKSLGYSYNSADPGELRLAEQLLLQQKPYVATYAAALLEDSGFAAGKYWMGMAFNGDALTLKAANPLLEFVIPEEGAGLWCDYLGVPTHATHPDLALAFIQFINEPPHAAALAKFTRFATTNQRGEALLEADFLNNPMIYPSTAILEKSEMVQPLAPRVGKQRTDIYTKVTRMTTR